MDAKDTLTPGISPAPIPAQAHEPRHFAWLIVLLCLTLVTIPLVYVYIFGGQ